MINEKDCYNNYINEEKITSDYYEESFGKQPYYWLTSLINLSLYDKYRNKLYWLNATIFQICRKRCAQSFLGKFIKNQIDADVLLIYQPLLTISSSMCKVLYEERAYCSFISLLSRQLIEQKCIIREMKMKNIEFNECILAAIESYNKQIRAQKLDISSNYSNVGLLKVFEEKVKFGDLVKKYDCDFSYQFFSGDVHAISSIERLLPKYKNDNVSKYEELYLELVLITFNDALQLLLEIDASNKRLIEE